MYTGTSLTSRFLVTPGSLDTLSPGVTPDFILLTMSSLPSPDDGHGQTHGGVEVTPGDAARGADADHQGQAVAEGDVEETSEEIVTASRVAEDNLGHRAVTKENQEKRPEQLSQENFHKPVMK